MKSSCNFSREKHFTHLSFCSLFFHASRVLSFSFISSFHTNDSSISPHFIRSKKWELFIFLWLLLLLLLCCSSFFADFYFSMQNIWMRAFFLSLEKKFSKVCVTLKKNWVEYDEWYKIENFFFITRNGYSSTTFFALF